MDLFADDVRRVFRSCGVPEYWGDLEAAFLLRIATDPGFLKPSCNDGINAARGKKFSEMSEQSEGMMPELLWKIDQKVKARTIRKNDIARVHSVANLYLRWNQEEVEKVIQAYFAEGELKVYLQKRVCELEELLESFWTEKSNALALLMTDELQEPINVKTIEKAREKIRSLKPFRFPRTHLFDFPLPL